MDPTSKWGGAEQSERRGEDERSEAKQAYRRRPRKLCDKVKQDLIKSKNIENLIRFSSSVCSHGISPPRFPGIRDILNFPFPEAKIKTGSLLLFFLKIGSVGLLKNAKD